ncbi:MAG: family 43 glycosylhydrolase [Bacteroidaceae bacterium]|nr:family 43 glycosylhydrolase [Bacteroidaceae bacterium]
MKRTSILITLLLALCTRAVSQTIVNGVPWFDQNGNTVNAHGACIVKENGKFYLFGEWKSDTSNSFPGFSCYSSDNLSDWEFRRVVLPMQKDGILGPERVGERCKVMRCPKTGEYVMLMHCDDMRYKDPHVGIATSKTIDGEYTFHGPILYNGKPIKKWDMGTFQDSDGTGYLLIHHGPIYRLSDDYRSIDTLVANVKGMGESPAMMKSKDGTYFLLSSNLTSWEKNDNFYHTAPSIEGPWTRQGLFCPEGTLTYNSQTTFVFNDGESPMFMGDRWSYPHQASAATYVWLPMEVEGTKLSIPHYMQSWNIGTGTETDLLATAKKVKTSRIDVSSLDHWTAGADGTFRSNHQGATIGTQFSGGRIAIYGETNKHGAYGKVSITDREKGEVIHSLLIDFYSKVTDRGLRYISPRLPKGKYRIDVEVTGDRPKWSDKKGNKFGTDNSYINIKDFYLIKE